VDLSDVSLSHQMVWGITTNSLGLISDGSSFLNLIVLLLRQTHNLTFTASLRQPSTCSSTVWLLESVSSLPSWLPGSRTSPSLTGSFSSFQMRFGLCRGQPLNDLPDTLLPAGTDESRPCPASPTASFSSSSRSSSSLKQSNECTSSFPILPL
jgi:hypothetical protein